MGLDYRVGIGYGRLCCVCAWAGQGWVGAWVRSALGLVRVKLCRLVLGLGWIEHWFGVGQGWVGLELGVGLV